LSSDEKKIPLMATGKIVEDYGLLYEYWKLAGDKASDAILRREDFEKVKEIAERGKISLRDLLDMLTNYFLERVDETIAEEAVRKCYDISVEREDAKTRVARLLAGWLIEASEEWGIIRIQTP